MWRGVVWRGWAKGNSRLLKETQGKGDEESSETNLEPTPGTKQYQDGRVAYCDNARQPEKNNTCSTRGHLLYSLLRVAVDGQALFFSLAFGRAGRISGEKET